MLILLGFIDRRHRRQRDALLLGFACAICLERLAALHAPPASPVQPAIVSAWAHGAQPRTEAGVVALNHARFMPQQAPAESAASSRLSTASMGLPVEAMANGAPFGFPYASR